MTSHYCAPYWHNGEHVPAELLIKGLEQFPDTNLDNPPELFYTPATGYANPSTMWCTCYEHLEPSLRAMTAWWRSVRVIDLTV